MTNIFHEYPEIAEELMDADHSAQLKHYQGMALEALETNMNDLTDPELVKVCLAHSTTHPLIAELSFRLNRYINLFKDVTKVVNHD